MSYTPNRHNGPPEPGSGPLTYTQSSSPRPASPAFASPDSPSGGHPKGSAPGRTGWWVAGILSLVLLLTASTTAAVVQSDRLGGAREDLATANAAAAEAQAQSDNLRAQVQDLEDQLAAQQQAPAPDLPAPDAPTDPFSDGSLEDLLGQGGLEDLLGEGGLEDLLDEGGLEDLLGDTGAAPEVNDCLADVADLPDIDATTLDEQFVQTTDAVQTLRGRAFPQPIEPTIKTGEEIREFFAAEIQEGYAPEVADIDGRIYSALGAIPTDLDLIQTQSELLGDQVAGYYDDETQELVVRAESGTDPLGGVGLITLAHELEHALTDATVGLPDLDGFGDDEDGGLAALAMVEGSAVALQSRFQVSALNPLDLLSELGGDLNQGLDEVPYFIRENLTFPYVSGPSYMCGRYADGGWDAVNEAIEAPPATSHEVMFPGSGVDPVDVPDTDGPEAYEEQARRTFGAAPLSWLFGAPNGDETLAVGDPTTDVEGWEGGEVTLFTDGDDSAVALVLSGAELCEPTAAWWVASATGDSADLQEGEDVAAATTDGRVGVVSCDGDDVRVGIGPTVEVARAAIA